MKSINGKEFMSEYEWLDIFSGNLNSILEEYGWDQKVLARRSCLCEATISNCINKKTMPSIRAVINMSRALKIPLDEFIDFGYLLRP